MELFSYQLMAIIVAFLTKDCIKKLFKVFLKESMYNKFSKERCIKC